MFTHLSLFLVKQINKYMVWVATIEVLHQLRNRHILRICDQVKALAKNPTISNTMSFPNIVSSDDGSWLIILNPQAVEETAFFFYGKRDYTSMCPHILCT